MPTFDSVLATYDKDHDGRLSHDEFKGDKDLGEHFGWIDADSDGFVTAKEWNEARAMGDGEFGAVAIHPGQSAREAGPRLGPLALQKESAIHPRAAGLPERVLHGARWRHYHLARSLHRPAPERRPDPRSSGRILRLARSCRKQDLPVKHRRQNTVLKARGVGGPGSKRPGRRNPRDSRAQRRPHIRADPRHPILFRRFALTEFRLRAPGETRDR